MKGKRQGKERNSENDNHHPVRSLSVSLQAYSLQNTKHLCWLYLHNQKGCPIHLKGFNSFYNYLHYVPSAKVDAEGYIYFFSKNEQIRHSP